MKRIAAFILSAVFVMSLATFGAAAAANPITVYRGGFEKGMAPRRGDENYDPKDKTIYTVTTGSKCTLSTSVEFNPVDASDYDYMFVRVFVEGCENIIGFSDGNAGGASIELCSGGICDNEERSWNTLDYIDKDGTYIIAVDLDEYAAEASTDNIPFDITRVNYMRIYFFVGDDPVKFAVDWIGFGNEGDSATLEQFNTTLDTSAIVVGNPKNWTEFTGEGESGDPVQVSASRVENPLDISQYSYMFIHIYVQNAGAHNGSSGGQIELTSSGNCDVEELGFSRGFAWELDEGWNYLKVSLDSGYSDGKYDNTKLSYFRLYSFVTDDSVIELDWVGFGNDDTGFGRDPGFYDRLPAIMISKEDTANGQFDEVPDATLPPTQAPTEAPTAAPTEPNSAAPTAAPTEAPTAEATEAPTEAKKSGCKSELGLGLIAIAAAAGFVAARKKK